MKFKFTKIFHCIKFYSTVNLLPSKYCSIVDYSIVVASNAMRNVKESLGLLGVASSTSNFTSYSTTAMQKRRTHF